MYEQPPTLEKEIPEGFAAYPRALTIPDHVPGTADQLVALSNGFVWLMWVWLLTLVAMYDVCGLQGETRAFSISPIILCAAITALAYPGCRKVAFGLGWSAIIGVLCALVVGVTSPFCIGIFLLAALLQRTATVISQYGVPRNSLGAFRRADVLETARRLSQRGSKLQEEASEPTLIP